MDTTRIDILNLVLPERGLSGARTFREERIDSRGNEIPSVISATLMFLSLKLFFLHQMTFILLLMQLFQTYASQRHRHLLDDLLCTQSEKLTLVQLLIVGGKDYNDRFRPIL
ncbi:hypothetical protein AVEN_237897-1 [Araneus ventricosus]|uniref:Uncharacterized protein n=1 Tax=Araneus ventricosus TaxID=182803 RepID=A0A4Y2U1Y6_ARAVE|nr:hypothetical protein AVEN_237897-1 [Araneus ventricosus]